MTRDSEHRSNPTVFGPNSSAKMRTVRFAWSCHSTDISSSAGCLFMKIVSAEPGEPIRAMSCSGGVSDARWRALSSIMYAWAWSIGARMECDIWCSLDARFRLGRVSELVKV